MFCPKCGAQLADDAQFCPACGAKIAADPAPVAEPVAAPDVKAEMIDEEEKHSKETKALVLGIISLVLALDFGWTIVGAIIAIVLGAKAIKIYEELLPIDGENLSGKVKAGRGLGKAGKIIGIIDIPLWVVFYVVYLIIFIIAIIAGEGLEALAEM